MAIFVFCSQKSTGAKTLAESLSGTRLRNFDGMDFWVRGRKVIPKAGDLIVCWGGILPEFEDVKVLNGKFPGNKFKSTLALQGGGVPTIKVATWKEADDYLPRLNNHVGGNDLLKPPSSPDFWVKRENIVKEYRIHSFCGKSIRAGVKVHRDGFSSPNEWIRSFDAGWKINYDTFKSTSTMRGIAHKAVKVLGLDFGAVDLGEKADGSFIVLEVNRAPGIEGGSVEAYKRSIQKWIEEGGAKVEGVEVATPEPTPVPPPAQAQAPAPVAPPEPVRLTAEQVVAATASVNRNPFGSSPEEYFARYREQVRVAQERIERRGGRVSSPTTGRVNSARPNMRSPRSDW